MRSVRKMGLVLMALAIFAIASPIYGQVIWTHSGGNDPASEGWTPIISGGTVGLVPNDAGPGADAWHTTDTLTTSSSSYYKGIDGLTAQNLTDIANNGWSMRATLRVDDFTASGFDETPGMAPGIQMAFEDTATWLVMALGSDSSGDTTLLLKGGNNLSTLESRTISGSGYNDYELAWKPGDGLDVLVNGDLLIDNMACTTTIASALGNRVFWGCADTGGVGAGYWTNVEFEVASPPPPDPFEGLYHTGGNDPTTEGWAAVISGSGDVGIELNDVGPGADAWRTRDPATDSSTAYYNGASALTPSDLDQIAKGWSMKATLRVDDFLVNGYDETAGGAPGMQIAFEDPGLWILFNLGTDANGDTTILLKGGYYNGVWTPSESHTIDGSGYNDYELRWDPTDGLDVFVNGEMVVDNFDCATDENWAGILGNRLFWGASDSGGKGAGFWSSVAFEAVPEPSVLLMLALGLPALLMQRRR